MKNAIYILIVFSRLVTPFALMSLQTLEVFASEPENAGMNINRPGKQLEHKPKPTTGILSVTRNNQPWQLIRRLQHAQDAIVVGKQGSLGVYRKLLVKYSGLMLAQDKSVWSSKKNLMAAAVYVLAGGNPAVGIKAVEVSELDDEAKQPLIAVVAYAERNFSTSRKLLIALDHTAIPSSAAAQFALAKSMVTSSTDLGLAKAYLNEARRLAPGTLVEEAALRRSFRIVDAKSNLDEYRRNASSYLRNFRKSLYFSDFLKNFSFGLMRMPREKEQEVLKYLKSFSEKIDENEQLRILVYTARSATVSGRVKTAYWSSKRALEILNPKSKFHARMRLYFAASGVVQPDVYEASVAEFTKINRSELDNNDQKLFDAVAVLVKRLQGDPMDLAKLNDIGYGKKQAYPGEVLDEPRVSKNEAAILSSNKVIIRAQKLFSDLDNIMSERSK